MKKTLTAIALVIAASSFNVQPSQAAASIPTQMQGTWCNDGTLGSWKYTDEGCDEQDKTMTVTSTGCGIRTIADMSPNEAGQRSDDCGQLMKGC
jgi:hypothetical protein